MSQDIRKNEMLTIELISDANETFQFGTGQDVCVFINENQFVSILVAKVLRCQSFFIFIDGEKKHIVKSRVVYIDNNIATYNKI